MSKPLPTLNTCTIGAAGEQLVSLDLQLRGFDTYRNASSAGAHDLVASKGIVCISIQVKSSECSMDDIQSDVLACHDLSTRTVKYFVRGENGENKKWDFHPLSASRVLSTQLKPDKQKEPESAIVIKLRRQILILKRRLEKLEIEHAETLRLSDGRAECIKEQLNTAIARIKELEDLQENGLWLPRITGNENDGGTNQTIYSEAP